MRNRSVRPAARARAAANRVLVVWTVVLAVGAACGVPAAQGASISVPATANPYLAGLPDGSTASSGDVAPAQSPVLYGSAVTGGDVFTFAVTGALSFTPLPPPWTTADGDLANVSGFGGPAGFGRGAENGIAGFAGMPAGAFVGLFLGDGLPTSSPAPAGLNFADGGPLGRSFATLAPGLKQVFFIGDGLTGTGAGAAQQFVAPAGATRLYLAAADGFGWFSNTGSVSVDVTQTPTVPLPQVPAAGAALFGTVALRRRPVVRG